MNWAELLNASLVAGVITPLLLVLMGLLATTRAIVIQIAVFTLLTVSAFWHGDAGRTVWFTSTIVILLLTLRRSRAQAKDRAQNSDKTLPQDHDRGTDQDNGITVKKP